MLAMGATRFVLGIELWLADIAQGTAKALTTGWESSWGPRWSPDGRWLAFYSDRNGEAQVWLWDRSTGESRAACAESVVMCETWEQLCWLPDSTRLVAKLRAPGWQPPQQDEEGETSRSGWDVWESPAPEVAQRSTEDEGWRWFDGSRGDIGIIDIETGEVRRLGTNIFPCSFVSSPDGRHVAAMCVADSEDFDLHVFAVDGSRREVLARDIPMSWGTFTWSPASDAVAYTTYSEEGEPGQLILVSLEGERRVLHDGSEVDFANEEPYPPPLWSPDGETIYCWANRAIYAVSLATGQMENITQGLDQYSIWGFIATLGANTVNDGGKPGTLLIMAQHRQTKQHGIFRVGNGQPEVIVPEQQRHLLNLMLYGDSSQQRIVGPIESASLPADLFRIEIATGEEKQITRLNPAFAGLSWGTGRLLDYAGVDDEALQGVVLLPPGYQEGERHPTVVVVYPDLGTTGYLNLFDWDRLGFIELHVLASRGYVVVVPGMPRRQPNLADELALLAENALEAAVAAGYADPERAGVMGHSAGGYSACCVVTRTDRFRAAVAGAPLTNLISYGLGVVANRAGRFDMVTGHVFKLREGLWDAPELWVENSPVFFCDKVNTPLLFLCGTADEPFMSQAEEMYGGLRKLGKRATLVRYYGEGHGVGEWSAENAQDCWDRIIGWFDRYVKGEGAD